MTSSETTRQNVLPFPTIMPRISTSATKSVSRHEGSSPPTILPPRIAPRPSFTDPSCRDDLERWFAFLTQHPRTFPGYVFHLTSGLGDPTDAEIDALEGILAIARSMPASREIEGLRHALSVLRNGQLKHLTAVKPGLQPVHHTLLEVDDDEILTTERITKHLLALRFTDFEYRKIKSWVHAQDTQRSAKPRDSFETDDGMM